MNGDDYYLFCLVWLNGILAMHLLACAVRMGRGVLK